MSCIKGAAKKAQVTGNANKTKCCY